MLQVISLARLIDFLKISNVYMKDIPIKTSAVDKENDKKLAEQIKKNREEHANDQLLIEIM